MKFKCDCGNVIHDTSDNLSYKGYIIADQDVDEFWSMIEEAEKPHVKKLDIFWKLDALMKSAIYQCPSCGRLFIDDPDDKSRFMVFAPDINGESDQKVNKRLLVSSHGDKWKGFLHAFWYDEKPSWCDYKGVIDPDVNIKYDNLMFDDYEAFENRFYEILEDMKSKNIIRILNKIGNQ